MFAGQIRQFFGLSGCTPASSIVLAGERPQPAQSQAANHIVRDITGSGMQMGFKCASGQLSRVAHSALTAVDLPCSRCPCVVVHSVTAQVS